MFDEFFTSIQITQLINDLLGNPHAENFDKGIKFLKVSLENTDWAILDSVDESDIPRIEKYIETAPHNKQIFFAIYEFSQIDESDKLYLRVAANFYSAICCFMIFDFEQAISYINKVETVTYSGITLNRDFINDCKNDCPELRQTVYNFESKIQELKQKIKEYKRTQIEGTGDATKQESQPSSNKWKVVSIILIFIVIIMAIVMISAFSKIGM